MRECKRRGDFCTFDPFDRNLSQYTFRETCAEDATLEMGDETTKIFLNSKGRREGIDSDLAAFLDYIEGKAPKGKFTESKLNRKLQRKRQSYVEHTLISMLH